MKAKGCKMYDEVSKMQPEKFSFIKLFSVDQVFLGVVMFVLYLI